MTAPRNNGAFRAAIFGFLLCLTVHPASVAAENPAQEMIDKDIAVLRSLDKTYARTTTFEVPVGQTVKFGETLFIRPQACRKTPPTQQPENAAFLQIWEHVLPPAAERSRAAPEIDEKDRETRWVFSGWMFSSSPALSAMDHQVFDVWLIDCKKADTTADSSKKVVVSGAAGEGEGVSDEEPPAEDISE